MATKSKPTQNKRSQTGKGTPARMRSEEAVLYERNLIRTLLENHPDFIYFKDRQARMQRASQRFCGFLGRSMDDIIGKTDLELFPEEVAKQTYNEDLQVINTGTPILNKEESAKGVWVLTTKTPWFDKEGNIIGLIGISRDITDRKKAQEQLRESEGKLRRLFESVADGIYAVDLEGVFTEANDAILKMYGFRSRDDLLGKNAFDFIAPRHAERAAMEMQRTFDQGGVACVDFAVLRVDGSEFPVEACGTLLRDAADNPVGFIGSVRDVTERRQAEEALRQSEEQYAAVVQNVADAVFRFKEGRITWANDRMEGMLGYSKEEMVGFDASLFLHSDVSLSEVYKEVGAGLEEQGFFNGRTRAKRKDGSVAEIEYSASQIPGTEPMELVGVARDITERKKTEEALQRSEEYHRSLLQNAMEGVAVLNRDGTLRSASSSAERMVGRDSRERMGTSIFEHIHPDDLPDIARIFAEMLHKAGGIAQAELRILHDDRTYHTLEVVARNLLDDPVVDGIVANFRDITERKRAEEALLIKDNAIEKSLTAIAITDIQGTVTYVNEACLALWRIAKGEGVVGQSFWALLQLDADTANVVALSMIEHGQWQGELKFLRRDGEQTDVQVLTAMVYDTHGNAIQTITSFVDVTERKKMEQQLLLSGRLAAVGELSAGIAHELNNPLAAVQAFAEFLAAREDLDETTKSDVQTIYNEAQRATRITSNLLSFARRHNPEKGLISISDVIEKGLELHVHRMNLNNIEIVTDFAPELPMTMADYHQLQQVFVNIITNAEQAMTEAHGRGKLVVRTRSVREMIQVTFTDDGPGIPKDNLQKLFDPFFTTKEVGEGTGLGLSICYGIVQEHSGRMYAESKAGGGATFVIELPVVSEVCAVK